MSAHLPVPLPTVGCQAAKAEGVLSVDLKGAVRPQLMALKDKINGMVHQCKDTVLGQQEMLTKLTETLGDKQEDVATMEKKLASLEGQYLRDKEVRPDQPRSVLEGGCQPGTQV